MATGRNIYGILIRDDERRWRNPLFEPPPLCICNQEERTTDNAEIGVDEERTTDNVEIGVDEERVSRIRREETSEEEDEFNNTSQRRVSIPTSPTTSNHLGGYETRLRRENQDKKVRLPMFHGTGKDDANKHWFTCEDIWYVKRITYKA
jgi:hypothetical protein